MNKNTLKTVANFSREYGYSPTYIYRLIENGKLKGETIDGVQFVDTSKVPADFKKKLNH